jgi:type VI protein secretion system component VasF
MTHTPSDYRRAALAAGSEIDKLNRRLDAALAQHDLDKADAIEMEIGQLLEMQARLHRKALIATVRPFVLVALLLIVAAMLIGVLL